MSGAKEHERTEARRLRADGLSLGAIARELGVAKSSVSVWVRDVPLSEEQRAALQARERRARQTTRAPRPPVGTSGLSRKCGSCEEVLPMEAFNRMGDGWQWRCRECFREYFRARGDLHRRQSGAAQIERRVSTKAYVLAHLETHPCVDCGEPDPVVLEFDHLRDKAFEISRLIAGGIFAQLLDELEKCEVVCVNCHRRRTDARGRHIRGTGVPPATWSARRKAAQRAVWEALASSGCIDCGERDLVVLDFDHRRDKRASPLRLVSTYAPFAEVLAEMEKCEVRCANCHRRRTAHERGWYRAVAGLSSAEPP